jgi:hypothetical protein
MWLWGIREEKFCCIISSTMVLRESLCSATPITMGRALNDDGLKLGSKRTDLHVNLQVPGSGLAMNMDRLWTVKIVQVQNICFNKLKLCFLFFSRLPARRCRTRQILGCLGRLRKCVRLDTARTGTALRGTNGCEEKRRVYSECDGVRVGRYD